MGVCGVNDSIPDRLQTRLSEGDELRGHCKAQGQGRHAMGGCGDGPGTIQSLASSTLAVNRPVCGNRNRVQCQQARLSQLQAVRSEEVPAAVQGWQGAGSGNPKSQGCKQ